MKKVFGPERTAQVDRILTNVEGASAKLDTALDDFSSLSHSLKQAAGEVAAFTDRLDPIGASVQTTLGHADEALVAARSAFARAETTLGPATGALGSAKTTFDDADKVLREQLPGIVTELSDAVATLRTAVAEIGGNASSVLGKFGDTADAAGRRLAELKTTLASSTRRSPGPATRWRRSDPPRGACRRWWTVRAPGSSPMRARRSPTCGPGYRRSMRRWSTTSRR